MAICKLYGIECGHATDIGRNSCIGDIGHPAAGASIIVRVHPCPALDRPQALFPPRSSHEALALIADLRRQGLSRRQARRIAKGRSFSRQDVFRQRTPLPRGLVVLGELFIFVVLCILVGTFLSWVKPGPGTSREFMRQITSDFLK